MDDDSRVVTWEDVVAVCKLLGIRYYVVDGEEVCIFRPNAWETFGTTFTDPAAALEFISAEEHPLEIKYANILRTKP